MTKTATNAKIVEITQRIIERSKPTRAAYLNKSTMQSLNGSSCRFVLR